MLIVYQKNKYPYAPLTSLLSSLNLFGIAILIIVTLIMGLVMVTEFSAGSLLYFLISLGATAFFIFIYNDKILPKMAEKEKQSNLRKSVSIALRYCQDHPGEYDTIAQANQKFAAKYMKDSNGKIVSRK